MVKVSHSLDELFQDFVGQEADFLHSLLAVPEVPEAERHPVSRQGRAGGLQKILHTTIKSFSKIEAFYTQLSKASLTLILF